MSAWTWCVLAARWLVTRWCRRCDGDAVRHGRVRFVAGVTVDGAAAGRDGDGDGEGYGYEECERRVAVKPRRNPWPFVIEPGDLVQRDKLTTLWSWSLSRGWRRETDLLRFVTLAISCERRAREGSVESAAGAFTSCLRRGLWWGTCDDEAKATTLIGDGFDTS